LVSTSLLSTPTDEKLVLAVAVQCSVSIGVVWFLGWGAMAST